MTSQQVVNQRIRLKSDQSTWSSSTLGNNGCRKNKGKMEDGKHRSDILKYMSQCLCVYNNDSLGQSRPKVQQCCTQYLFDSYLSISFTSSCHNLYLYLFHCFIVWLYHCCMIVSLYVKQSRREAEHMFDNCRYLLRSPHCHRPPCHAILSAVVTLFFVSLDLCQGSQQKRNKFFSAKFSLLNDGFPNF